jgi:hypothetical protein
LKTAGKKLNVPMPAHGCNAVRTWRLGEVQRFIEEVTSMTVRTFSLIALFFLLLCAIPSAGQAQEIQYREEPLPLEEMEDYKDIPFRQDNFEKITQGMSAKDVLTLLGKPLDMKKEQRKGHRWTFHYYYPEGHTVHFKNGLVVGKEKE